MADRYVESCGLGQARKTGPEQDGTMGSWRKPGWEPAGAAFKCSRCRWVTPSTLFSPEEHRRFVDGGEPMMCDGCLEEVAREVPAVAIDEGFAWDERDG